MKSDFMPNKGGFANYKAHVSWRNGECMNFTASPPSSKTQQYKR